MADTFKRRDIDFSILCLAWGPRAGMIALTSDAEAKKASIARPGLPGRYFLYQAIWRQRATLWANAMAI